MPGAHAGCVHSFAVMRPAAAELALEGRAEQLSSARLW